MMDFSKLTELEKGFRPLCCDKGIGLECCTDKCAADVEQSELVAERAAKAQGALTDEQIDAIYRKTDKVNTPQDDYRHREQLKQSRYAFARAILALAPSIQALPVVAPSDSSMPVDISQAKRWITQLRGRVDSLLAIINAPAAAAQPDLSKLHRYDVSESGPCFAPNDGSYVLYDDLVELLAAAQPEAKQAPAALSDEQIESLWQALPGIEIHNKAAKSGMDTGYAIRIAHARAVLAAAGNSQDAKDAARYRWLREKGYGMPKQEEELDSAIDAAMAAAPSPAEGAPAPAKEAP